MSRRQESELVHFRSRVAKCLQVIKFIPYLLFRCDLFRALPGTLSCLLPATLRLWWRFRLWISKDDVTVNIVVERAGVRSTQSRFCIAMSVFRWRRAGLAGLLGSTQSETLQATARTSNSLNSAGSDWLASVKAKSGFGGSAVLSDSACVAASVASRSVFCLRVRCKLNAMNERHWNSPCALELQAQTNE